MGNSSFSVGTCKHLEGLWLCVLLRRWQGQAYQAINQDSLTL